MTEQILCCFVASLADQGLAPQTAKSYLSAVRNMQISLGMPDPREESSLNILKRVQAGVSRCRLLKGSPKKVRLPITAKVLLQVKHHLSLLPEDERAVVWCIACTAFFGFFRLGELLPDSIHAYHPATSLSWGDVAVDSHVKPRMVQVFLKQSKCDQFGAGARVVLGVTGEELCPVATIIRYIELRGNYPGPFFLDSSRNTIPKPWFISRIRSTLTAIGLPEHLYAGHSFRIGAATTASLAGVEDSTVQSLGRWNSAAFLQYIRTPKERLARVCCIMAQSGTPCP